MKWTAMIMQPEWVTRSIVDEAVLEVANKKELPALPKLRFETLEEIKCAQVLYISPYAGEESTIKNLHNHIESSGQKLRGKHHEIYLNDARRTALKKLKTIIRQPFS